MVVFWIPVLVVILTFVVDVGNWFEHKRHLQMQADAAALAGAQGWGTCPDDSAISAAVAAYGGDVYNAQVGSTPPVRVSRLINSKTFYNQPDDPDDTVVGSPCTAGMLDVKLTEVDLPWFLPSFFSEAIDVDFINAQARVSVNQVASSVGALPVGVPDTNPKSAHATFINEATGAVLGSTDLVKTGTSSGLAVWDNAGAPLPVTLAAADQNVGVVIALGGLSSTTCGQPLVTCYDLGAAKLGSGLPSTGIVHLNGWSAAGNGAQPNDPILRDVTLVPGTCVDPYFSSAASACTFGVRARVDFGPGDPLRAGLLAKVNATVGGTTLPLTYSSTTGRWSSATTFALAPGAGPVPVKMDWVENAGTLTSQGSPGGNNCGTTGGNKCKGSFGTVHGAFSASAARSGPIKIATISKDGFSGANSLERCSAVQTSCTHNLVVTLGVKGNLANASSASDPIVAMRVAGGSQNQSLDCDPAVDTLKGEIAGGCQPTYARNSGTACPGSDLTLWATAQPWTCVAVQTGGAVNQVPAGLNLRVLGSEKPTTCPVAGAPGHNNWSLFPAFPPNDPRIIEVFLTPFGSFDGSGSTTVPVTDFATFYVTGWTGQGQGFNNPCQGNGDDPVPIGADGKEDPGVIVGHFIKYIQATGTGSGTTACDPNAFGSCVAVMTR
jgi:Putative Flp pilus-assembly TadE/G-like